MNRADLKRGEIQVTTYSVHIIGRPGQNSPSPGENSNLSFSDAVEGLNPRPSSP
jgi:hypothetical protein